MPVVSPPSFDDFYVRYVPLVRRILVRRGVTEPDLDDVTQETFVTLHRLLPAFEGRSTLETWLHSVAWRIAANHRRRKRLRAAGPLSVARHAEHEPDSEPLLVADRYQASFHLIDDDNRDLIALHEIGGLSISVLAELTGNARATIRRRLESSRAKLERLLKGDGPSLERVVWLESVAARFDNSLESAPTPFMRVLPDGATCISTVDDLVVAVWRGPSTNDALQVLIETLFAHARNWPGGVRYLNVVEATSSPPTREGRDMMVWAARKLGKKLIALASTVEGTLMPYAASLMNTAFFLARAAFEVRYFGEAPQALAWLEQFGPIDVEQALDHLACMRQRLAESHRS
ncbi:MAG TPA: RNA polymerase sigma factor [Polyangiales bacterium]|nr:RNA polymerase sigma factor [Polyangiales bacterium]